MQELLLSLRSIAEATRLRILYILLHGEFTVGELTFILGQSQPRVSRHLKLMAEANLLTRHKEGNWVFLRLKDHINAHSLPNMIIKLLPQEDEILKGDRLRLKEIINTRSQRAEQYFNDNASAWAQLRALHIEETDVETSMINMIGTQTINNYVDLGTGTGRLLQLFANLTNQAIGIDLNHDMLTIARSHLNDTCFKHVQLRQADLYRLPLVDNFSELVTLHQVLHYLDDPERALKEAARILSPNGRMLIVDFAPHNLEVLRNEHAHRRLGIASEKISSWLADCHLQQTAHTQLPPPPHKEKTGLTVSLWLARKEPMEKGCHE